MWRYIKDEKYGGYAIQKYHKFLFWSWWSNEYLSQTEKEAERFLNKKMSLHINQINTVL